MRIDDLNLNHLRVFECVYQHGCMTTAAQNLHLTQSGVSQHIKSLESSIGAALFDRVNRKVMPTDAGHTLYKQAWPALLEIEKVVENISSHKDKLSGNINIGMPIEFGNNMIVPVLSEIGRKYPHLNFKMTLDYADKLAEKILDGELDFALLDDYHFDKRFAVRPVYKEYLKLCIGRSYLKEIGEIKYTKSFFEKLRFVAYQENGPILRSWCSHHLKRKNVRLDIRAQIMDVQGVSKFILNGLGVGVLPHHLVEKLKANKDPIEIVEGRNKPLSNVISLAYLSKKNMSKAHSTVISELEEALKAL